MLEVTLYTNYLSDEDKQELQEALHNGKAVCVSSACIGHTKAAIVQAQGEQYLESIGCRVVRENSLHEKFYALPLPKYPKPRRTQLKKPIRL